MTLSKKTLFYIGITITSLIGVLYATSSTILLNSIREAEKQNTRQAVAGVLGVFTQTQDDFNYRFNDWSAWDDTYVFIKDANKSYIKSNLIPESLVSLEVNLTLFIQPSGRIVFGTGFDQIHQKETPIPEALRAHLSPKSLLLRHRNPKSSIRGIIVLPQGPMLISSRPIVTSEEKGPIRGTLIFGRFLDADLIAKLTKISRLSLTMHALNETMPADFQLARNSLSEEPILIRPLSEQTIAAYTLLPDIYGKPAVLLRVDIPREIYHQGQKSLRYLIASLLVVGLVFGGVTLQLLRRLVLSQRKWQQSEEYRNLVAQASESIFLVDADTKRILETNAAFEKLLKLSSAEACFLTLYDIVAGDCESIDHNLLTLTETHHFTGEQQYHRQDGQLVDVEVNANLISQNGKNVFCIIVHDITKRKQIEKQLLHNAFHDSLTGLANRALFMERLEHAIQLSKRRENYLFAVLFLDLDRFKVINDSLGHMAGDQLLIAITHRLKGCLRSDTFARLGGDEFAVLSENRGNATELVENIQQQLKVPFNLNGQEVFATVSIGVIDNIVYYDGPEELLRDADTAMYRAKARGRARHEVFNVTMHDHAVALLQLETDLRRAVVADEFQLHYQPITSLLNNRIVGFEALVRWHHPKLGLVSPADFIPIAEETGLIIPLGWWVMREACRQMRVWQVQFPVNPPLTVSVNFSVKQFTQPKVVEQIAQILNETNLDARSLKLELTESVLVEYPESVTAVMQQLQALGVLLYLDDFGTGYSSLSYLHRFPIKTLKIDRSFVSRMTDCSESWEIVRAITMLAQALNIDVIAEGIETSAQLAQLNKLQCNYGQGYFFSKPLDAATAGALIAQKLTKNEPSVACRM